MKNLGFHSVAALEFKWKIFHIVKFLKNFYQLPHFRSKRIGRSQDGGGIRRGDHFLFYKFIERTTERWTKFTKQLLIASGRYQEPRKAAHCLQKEGKEFVFLFSFFFFFFLFFLFSFLSFLFLVFPLLFPFKVL